jgi:CubicO group peptidase (beta-lactamase class C family)
MKKLIQRTTATLLAVLMIAAGLGCTSESSRVVGRESGAPDTLIDLVVLDSLVTAIGTGTYGQVRSVLIHRKDRLVFERYFGGYHREYRQEVFSVTKSVMSALIGIAIDRGDIADVNETMLAFFTNYTDIANLVPEKQAVTLEHLLTMAAGLEWDEWTLPYAHPDNDVNLMYSSDDWVKYTLDLPMVDAPGTRFTYNSGVSMLLSAILTRSTGISASDYAADHLFGRMGLASWWWDPAPENPGMSIGGWGLHMRPLDMVEFGRLFLYEGSWGSEQVVPAHWVSTSTRAHMVIDESKEYGYQWWTYSDRVVADGLIDVNDVYRAVGRGGQYIWVVPHYDLVAVSTAWNDNNGKSSDGMFFRYIVPAVQSTDRTPVETR